eukprot:TRINITY_DN2701_c0_g2_i1.p4 TRINITY_DN2701_c0_g2~~TRINITY_DN2701_c0_g2_i1.p4  ORF type:complete len:118 (-),score=9.36 TRINITY_DN2701_c0_g2_i1:123-476(-)
MMDYFLTLLPANYKKQKFGLYIEIVCKVCCTKMLGVIFGEVDLEAFGLQILVLYWKFNKKSKEEDSTFYQVIYSYLFGCLVQIVTEKNLWLPSNESIFYTFQIMEFYMLSIKLVCLP